MRATHLSFLQSLPLVAAMGFLGSVGAACGTDPAESRSEPAPAVRVLIDTTRPVVEVSPRFLSFALDSSRISRDYDFANPRLRKLAGELAPAYLRIGGTSADAVYYDLSDDPVPAPPDPYRKVLTRKWWDGACAFASDLGLEILFTLNAGAGPRDSAGRWTPHAARTLIEYTKAHHCPVTVWELGNEINGFFLANQFCLTGAEYAVDMAAARRLIDEVDPTARLAGPADIYWPLWGEIPPILPGFMTAGGHLVDVVTWHYYPQFSRECPITPRRAELDTLFSPANLDEIARWAKQVESARDRHGRQAEVWLGETGHALCGGEEGMSDRFVTGFWWLDQLGLIARRKEPVVIRQSLTGGNYELIDESTLEPNPDYFNSLLWKRLMGTSVLEVSTAAPNEEGLLRAYAHCTLRSAGPAGSVTVVAINLDSLHSARVSFAGIGGPREVYLMTASDLLAQQVQLNGKTLAVSADGSPPSLEKQVMHGDIILPPHTYAFVVLPEARAVACGGP